jgi:hypothetical protein
VKSRGKKESVAAPRKRKSKGKRHHVHAESLDNIADDIVRLSGDPITPQMTNAQLLNALAHIFRKETQRVRTIVR